MSRLTRDGTAEPVSRDQILRHARGQGKIIFPVQLTTSRIGNPTRLTHTLLYVMTIHTYIPTANLRVLVRCDLNVPLEGSTITDDTRIRASLPTITYLVDKGAKVREVPHKRATSSRWTRGSSNASSRIYVVNAAGWLSLVDQSSASEIHLHSHRVPIVSYGGFGMGSRHVLLQVLLSSHLGRPKDGPDPKFSLSPVAERLTKLLGKTVTMAPDCIGPQVSKVECIRRFYISLPIFDF